MVDKIITYETSTFRESWFDTIVFMGGDIHDDPGTDLVEGEVGCDYIYDEYMNDFQAVRLYASNKNIDVGHVPSPENIIREISKGCGFVILNAHGYPDCVDTFWPGEFSWDDSPGGLGCFDIPKLSNRNQLPICLFNGCLCGMFNVTFFGSLFERPHMWSFKYIAIPECISWWMTKATAGGSVASLGFTGIGYGNAGEKGDLDGDGINNPDCIESYNGYQLSLFFRAYSEGENILAKVMNNAQRLYLNTYPPFEEKRNHKQATIWTLFGDPSLKIGGYPQEKQ